MKKLLLAVFCLTNLLTGAIAQSCTPDTNSYEFFAPSSDNFPCIEHGVAFSAPIYFFIPADFSGVTIDSAQTTDISGLPAGLTYTCNPSTCGIAGGQHGCLNISGTTNVAAGNYTFTIVGYVKTSQGTYTLQQLDNGSGMTEYNVTIIEAGASCNGVDTTTGGIFSATLQAVKMEVLNTNNANNYNVRFTSDESLTGELLLMDLSGRVVSTQSASIFGTTVLPLNLQEYQHGLYLLAFRTSKGSLIKKLVVK